jgi:thioredoxin reductase (NADPH)
MSHYLVRQVEGMPNIVVRPWPLAERRPLSLETSMPGVFAAGDVRHGSMNRVASAAGEGSIAIRLVHELFEAEQIQSRDRKWEPTG